MNLTGLYYPITEAGSEKVVAKRKIVDCIEGENFAGYVVLLKEGLKQGNLISYSAAAKLIEQQKDLDNLPEIK